MNIDFMTKKILIKKDIEEIIFKSWELIDKIDFMEKDEFIFHFNLFYDINKEIEEIRENLKKENYSPNYIFSNKDIIYNRNDITDYIYNETDKKTGILDTILKDMGKYSNTGKFTEKEILNLFNIIKEIRYYIDRFY